MLKKIIVTGSDGRFAQELKKIQSKYNFIFTNKKKLNVLSLKSINKNFKNLNPDGVIHLAGLSRPMSIHEKNINQSIDSNIISTSNLVKVCNNNNVKLIYLSTSYVYPGKKGNYNENDSILPWNNYGWSKLGAESAVQMYENSLIIRACMTEKPFTHKFAFSNVKTNFIFHDEFAKILVKIIHYKGILNVGGKSQSVYQFAKKNNKNVNKKKSKGELPFNIYMNLNKIKKLIKK